MGIYKEKLEELIFVEKVFDAIGIATVQSAAIYGSESAKLEDLLLKGFRVVSSVQDVRQKEVRVFLERRLSHEERLMLYRNHLKTHNKKDQYFNFNNSREKVNEWKNHTRRSK